MTSKAPQYPPGYWCDECRGRGHRITWGSFPWLSMLACEACDGTGKNKDFIWPEVSSPPPPPPKKCDRCCCQ